MQDGATEEPGDCGEPDVRMGADLEWGWSLDIVGTHQIDETPRADCPPLLGWQNSHDPEFADAASSALP